MKFLSLDRPARLRSRWVIQRPGRTPQHRLRPQRQRRTAGGEFLVSRGMTKGQGKKVASQPLRLGGRGKAGPSQIKPVKRPQAGGLPKDRDMVAIQSAGLGTVGDFTCDIERDASSTALFNSSSKATALRRKPPFVRASKRGGAVHSLLADCLRVPSISSISHTFWRANMASLRAAISRSCFWPTDGLIHAKKPVGMPHYNKHRAVCAHLSRIFVQLNGPYPFQA